MVAIFCMNPDRANEVHLIVTGFILHPSSSIESGRKRTHTAIQKVEGSFSPVLWRGFLSLVGRWDCNEPPLILLPRINLCHYEKYHSYFGG